MLEDLIINYPSVNNSDYGEIITQKEKEIEILNNICSGMIENSYIGRSKAIRYINPFDSLFMINKK